VSDNKRSYISNKFFLDLGHGDPGGWLLSAEGGMASTEPVQERLAGGHPVRKHAGNVKVEDITVTCGTAMSEKFYQWIQKSINYQSMRQDGAIITTNMDFKEIVRQNFYETLLAEVSLPAVDASSKDAAKFTLKMSPEYTETKYSNGTQAQTASIVAAPQKRWQVANFKFSVDGMDCARTHKVEALNIKQNIVENTIGERLIFQKEPAQIDFPNVVFTLPERVADPWYKWYDDFVCKGNSAPSFEKSGQLEYLAPDCHTILFIVQFYNLGIIKYTPDKLDIGTEKTRSVKIEMYCEKMTFDYQSTGKS
jgi:hypothetical protein